MPGHDGLGGARPTSSSGLVPPIFFSLAKTALTFSSSCALALAAAARLSSSTGICAGAVVTEAGSSVTRSRSDGAGFFLRGLGHLHVEIDL